MAHRLWHSFPIFVPRRTASPTANLVPIGRAASSTPRVVMFSAKSPAPTSSPSARIFRMLSSARRLTWRSPSPAWASPTMPGFSRSRAYSEGTLCVAFRKERFQVDVPRGKEAPLGESVGGRTDAVAVSAEMAGDRGDDPDRPDRALHSEITCGPAEVLPFERGKAVPSLDLLQDLLSRDGQAGDAILSVQRHMLDEPDRQGPVGGKGSEPGDL